jgi:hypothetical protein
MIEQFTDRFIKNPFTIQFSLIFWDSYGLWENGRSPFSDDWKTFWDAAAALLFDVETQVAIVRKNFDEFKKSDGLFFLEELYKRRANPNFLLTLFIQYLWNPTVPKTENEAPDFKVWQTELDAIRLTRRCAERFSTNNPHIQYLLSLEELIHSAFIEPKDIRQHKKHPPSDKENRVIFTVYEHVRRKTNNPQWQLVFDLLKSAKVIRGNSVESPHRHLKPRIESFQKDHPKEALFLRDHVLKEDRPFWSVRSDRLGPLRPNPLHF